MNSLQIKSQPNKKPFKPTSCPQDVREQLCPYPHPRGGGSPAQGGGAVVLVPSASSGSLPCARPASGLRRCFWNCSRTYVPKQFQALQLSGQDKGMLLEPGLPLGPSRVQSKTTDRTRQDGCGASSPNTRSAGGPCTSPEYPSMEEMILPPSHGCKIRSKGS